MKHLDDELLEAIWVVSETEPALIVGVEKRCDEDFDDSDLERLQRSGLLNRSGLELLLTAAGKRHARKLVRCHRLAEVMLQTVFDLDWQAREDIACEVEHTLVPELVDGICTLLGHPAECPDGKPIPPGTCCVAHRQSIDCSVIPLADLPTGITARVLFIRTKSPERAQQLVASGLVPGLTVELLQRTPAYRIRFEGTELALDRAASADVLVSPISDRAERSPRRGVGKPGLFATNSSLD
ncbi:MAG: metal-dependent transcriptional regulator [Deltaproteobacteria bacterium]|nr:metal-dependent transcriptional regulator [Deltaproteobacteria bacterium]